MARSFPARAPARSRASPVRGPGTAPDGLVTVLRAGGRAAVPGAALEVAVAGSVGLLIAA
ncbi:hypothetical protein ACFVUW_11945 [Streptomyces xiamenensis]|uniref:hypothetical protein n=1 Tax=Streptomyces xiamenensis TaxID=408015 RepID=UPI0036E5EED7